MAKRSKLKIRSVIICEGVRVEASGQHTIIGVFTGAIRTTNPPIEIPQLSVRIEFDVLDKIDEDYVFAFMTPSQVRLFETRSRMRIEKGKRSVVTISSGPAVFSESGIYKVRFGPVGRERIVEKITVKFEPKSP